MKQPGLYVIYAAAVRDAAGIDARRGAVLVLDGGVVAAGDPASFDPDVLGRAEVIERPGDLLLPAMVNAHTHLELTAIGPRPYDPAGGFVGWVADVIKQAPRTTRDGHRVVGQGADMSTSAGVQAVGDIGPVDGVYPITQTTNLDGVTYRELFGLGEPFDKVAKQLIPLTHGECSKGLQPHAPYSAGPDLYALATATGRPVSTHLAEHKEELDFVGKLAGPILDYLKTRGRWDDAFSEHYGQGLSPTQWMRPHLEAAADAGGWLVAHCNYVDDADIKLLADTNTSVAYCPIASEYFGHHCDNTSGGHRYRDMLAAGINVCLGTDSIVGTDPDDPQPLGVLGAMRRLYQRDGTDPATLLAMATTHGTRALRLDDRVATLQPGAPAKFACIQIDTDASVQPLVQVLSSQEPVESLALEWQEPTD